MIKERTWSKYCYCEEMTFLVSEFILVLSLLNVNTQNYRTAANKEYIAIKVIFVLFSPGTG